MYTDVDAHLLLAVMPYSIVWIFVCVRDRERGGERERVTCIHESCHDMRM